MPAVLLRVFCTLAVAIVATFHVCGIASVRDLGPATIAYEQSSEPSRGDADVTAEKCHVCTVVSLPATLDGGAELLAQRPAPGVPSRLLSFLPSATAPPPRA